MSPSDQSSNRWKSLAEELGAPWPEEEPAEETPQPSGPPDALAEPAVSEPAFFDKEPSAELEPSGQFESEVAPTEGDALFGDEELHEAFGIEAGRSETSEDAAPVVPAAPTLAEPPAPALDRGHWRSLVSELGLELPPEPEPLPEPPPAPSQPELKMRAVDEATEGEIVEAELLEPPPKKAAVEKKPAAPALPFGAGLFSEEEERLFAPPTPVTESAAAVELGMAGALLEDEIEEAPSKPGEDELETPRKRARRRTRSWKRLHATEAAEKAELPPTADEAELAEIGAGAADEDLETLDDLFGDVDAPGAETGDAATDDEPRRRRRRRRRTRRGERAEEGVAASEAEEAEEGELEEELEEAAALDEEAEAEEEFPRRERPRRRAAATAEDFEAEGDEDDEGEQGGRPSHRKIPSWEEAVGIVVAANMEARAKSPGRRRR